jgi:DNA-directed RNA polymerase specialized sigma24 family protein
VEGIGAPVAELHFSGVDWNAVLKRVAVRTAQVFVTQGLARNVAVRPYGKSAEDYVSEAIGRLWDPNDHGVEWDERHGKATTEGVVAFLNHVIRNDIRDDLKGKPHHRTRTLEAPSSLDPNGEAAPHEPVDERSATDEDLLAKVDRERIYMKLLEAAEERGDAEVIAYLFAQFDDGEYLALKPQEVAQRLGTSTADINNRKRQLSRLIADLVTSRPGASGPTERQS